MHRHSPLDCEIDNPELTCPHCGWVASKPNMRRNCKVRMREYFRWHWGDTVRYWLSRWGIGYKGCSACDVRRQWLNSVGMFWERQWKKAKLALQRMLHRLGHRSSRHSRTSVLSQRFQPKHSAARQYRV